MSDKHIYVHRKMLIDVENVDKYGVEIHIEIIEHACIAQLVERITRNDEVTSSILVAGSFKRKTLVIQGFFF